MTTNSAGIIITAGGLSLSLDFYRQLFGAPTWNPEQVAVANSDSYALAYMPLMVASIIVSALSSPAGAPRRFGTTANCGKPQGQVRSASGSECSTRLRLKLFGIDHRLAAGS